MYVYICVYINIYIYMLFYDLYKELNNIKCIYIYIDYVCIISSCELNNRVFKCFQRSTCICLLSKSGLLAGSALDPGC